MQELDRVDEKEEIDGSLGSLEILEYVLGEELDDIDENVGGGDSMLIEAEHKEQKRQQEDDA